MLHKSQLTEPNDYGQIICFYDDQDIIYYSYSYISVSNKDLGPGVILTKFLKLTLTIIILKNKSKLNNILMVPIVIHPPCN